MLFSIAAILPFPCFQQFKEFEVYWGAALFFTNGRLLWLQFSQDVISNATAENNCLCQPAEQNLKAERSY